MDELPGDGDDHGAEHHECAAGDACWDVLADLQAGLLDEVTAARLRARIRADADLARRHAALTRVRRGLADLGTALYGDDPSSPAPPVDVSDRLFAAIRAATVAAASDPSAPIRRGPTRP